MEQEPPPIYTIEDSSAILEPPPPSVAPPPPPPSSSTRPGRRQLGQSRTRWTQTELEEIRRLQGKGASTVESLFGCIFAPIGWAWSGVRWAIHHRQEAKERAAQERADLERRAEPLLQNLMNETKDPKVLSAAVDILQRLERARDYRETKEAQLESLVQAYRGSHTTKKPSPLQLKAALRARKKAIDMELSIQGQADALQEAVGRMQASEVAQKSAIVMKAISGHGQQALRQFEAQGGQENLEQALDGVQETVSMGADISQSLSLMTGAMTQSLNPDTRYMSPGAVAYNNDAEIEAELNELLYGDEPPPRMVELPPVINGKAEEEEEEEQEVRQVLPMAYKSGSPRTGRQSIFG